MARFFLLCLLAIVGVTLSEQFDIGTTSSTPRKPEAKDASRKYAGRYVSLVDQCRGRKLGQFMTFCMPENVEEVCAKLYCTSERGDIPSVERSGRALKGTWCGDKKMCSKGRCVDDPNQPEDIVKQSNGESCKGLIKRKTTTTPSPTPLTVKLVTNNTFVFSTLLGD